DVSKDCVRFIQRGQERVGDALLGFGRGRELADETFAAVDAAEYVLEGVRNLHEVVDEVLTRGDELIDVGLARGRNHCARLQRVELRAAGRNVDVAVARQQAELLHA